MAHFDAELMSARFELASAAIDEGNMEGRIAMEAIYTELCRLPPRQLDANRGELRSLRDRALHEIIGALMVERQHARALEWVEIHILTSPDADNETAIRQKAYLLHVLGDSQGAGELIVGLLDQHLEPSYLFLPAVFFLLARYGQYKTAHAWIASRRDPATAPPAWNTAMGRQFLFRLEAQVLLEEGLSERAIAAYDKASRADKDADRHTGGLAEDFVVLGWPNLALRILSKVQKPTEDEVLWKALALRAVARFDEARAIFVEIADQELPDDEYLILYWVLANGYLHMISENGICELLEMYIEEGVEFDDVTYYAYAVALALDDRIEDAQKALTRAVNATRRDFLGVTLDRERWYHVTQLLDAEGQRQLRPWFDPKRMPERIL